MTGDQYGALVINGWQSILDPIPHGIFVMAAQLGNFFHRVAIVDFNETIVWMTFSHCLAHSRYLYFSTDGDTARGYILHGIL